MIRTVIKLLIAAAVINACVRVGLAAWGYYQLKDAVHELVLFGANVSTTDLHNEIVDRAASLNLPLDPGDVDVTRDGLHTIVQAHYTQPVELFPGYIYPMPFSFRDDALPSVPPTAKDVLGQP